MCFEEIFEIQESVFRPKFEKIFFNKEDRRFLVSFIQCILRTMDNRKTKQVFNSSTINLISKSEVENEEKNFYLYRIE